MIQVILIAHGKLAIEMKNSAEMIFGELPDFTSLEFCKEEGLDSVKEKVKNAINSSADEVIVFTDLFCGTPYNASCAVAMEKEDDAIEVVSGMSLPLILEVASMMSGQKAKEIIESLKVAVPNTFQSFKDQVIEMEEDF